jgi:hypothetical protein
MSDELPIIVDSLLIQHAVLRHELAELDEQGMLLDQQEDIIKMQAAICKSSIHWRRNAIADLMSKLNALGYTDNDNTEVH